MSKIYKISEFAKRVGCASSTLRRYDLEGKFPAKRTATGQRYYTEEDVRKYLNLSTSEDRKIVVYSRVSSSSQKDDLQRQKEALEIFCQAKGLCVDDWIEEIGGGMNFKREKFLQLCNDISLGKVSKLIIAHKDRLVRFGFDYFEHLTSINDCEIIIMNQESLSPQEEMVQDLMAIIHTFSCRLYGLRKYKKKIKEVACENK